MVDLVNEPPHYKAHPSGVQCIEIVEHLNFCMGNAVKYIWRADQKGKPIQDLEKALFYIKRELARRGKSEEEGLRETVECEHPPCDRVNESHTIDENSIFEKGYN